MTVYRHDTQGRPVVRLGWGDRTVGGIFVAIIVAAICWMGHELVVMRDTTRDELIYRSQVLGELSDHESRIRFVERRP